MPSDDASRSGERCPVPSTETDTGAGTESACEPGTADQGGSEPPTVVEGKNEPEGCGHSEDGAQAVEAGREPIAKVEQADMDKARKPSWWNRKSLRAIRREALMDHTAWAEFDKRDNEASRLPLNEEVHLGGLVLAEAFTPSTISGLKRALADFPGDPRRKAEWLSNLEQGRSAGGSGGSQSLGAVRRPGEFGFGSFDPGIPDAVDAIWPVIFSLTPSLTIVVATFTFKDEDGDLSSILRADYETSAADLRVQVRGRLGQVRQHIPWARPKSYTWNHELRRAEDEKRLACEAAISDLEEPCWTWFSKNFPGRFSREDRDNRPTGRILLTKESAPFEERSRALAPVGLSSVLDIWRSQDQPGWALNFRNWPSKRRYSLIVAARVRDAAQSPGGDETDEFIWYLTQMFAQNQSPLVARWAAACLLSLYADQLASLRDRAGVRRKIARPVSQARDLDNFLIGDGLDASTIVADIDILTQSLTRFRFDVAEYSEDLSAYPENVRNSREPAELVPGLMSNIQNQAHMLKRDMEAATSNITASAQLRQAIANTTVQRRILILTVVAIAIALVSLFVAIHANNATANTVHSTATNPARSNSKSPSPLPTKTSGHRS